MKNFYSGKKVLVTGHTGFKGSWMCKLLIEWDANVIGYALQPAEGLYQLTDIDSKIKSYIGDIRDLKLLNEIFEKEQPEIVIHLAAQPLVREAYASPVYTYAVNVMGTVNVMECVRNNTCVKSLVNVTTDKVYENKEWEWGYRENENLNGFDPYSNSKSCSELVTSSYCKSFFEDRDVAVSTARAGNVIGGGDFSKDRIIPDCVRAALNEKNIRVRNKNSVRPYQHVLEPIYAYLLIAKKQYEDKKFAGCYNVGPDEKDCWTTGLLVEEFCKTWNTIRGKNIGWYSELNQGPHEANFLKLDCSHIKKKMNWKPTWDVRTAIGKTVEWYNIWDNKQDINKCMKEQIQSFLSNQ